MTAPLDLVRRFCADFASLDLEVIGEYFSDDAVYHNIPVDPVVGRDAIRATIAGFTTGVESVEFAVVNAVAEGSVVLTERVDTFVWPGGHRAVLPVMGVFEVRDGQIDAWRDYFDLQQFMTQLPAST